MAAGATLGIDEARRIALAAQGFSVPRPTGRVDRRHVRRVIDRMGLVQIDSVNVLVRSQELPLFSRLGPHRRDAIARATEAGELFEYWGHEAAHIPTDRYPLWRWKMEGDLRGGWLRADQALRRRRGFVDRIYDHVARHGPTTAGDLSERVGKKGPWWDWDDAKVALELLFMTGRLTATRRGTDFARLYDLPERVIPRRHLDAPAPDAAEAQRRLVELAARSLGVATAFDLADYYRLPLSAVKVRLGDLTDSGDLQPVRVAGWKDQAYLHRSAECPSGVDARAVVSMFDPVVWNRPRAERLFDFHYRIEIYTPAAKRRYGYYVLPFLCGDRLVARVDVKADRRAGTLLVPGVFGETGIDRAHVASELADELRLLADWLDLERIDVGRLGDLSTHVRRRLAGAGR